MRQGSYRNQERTRALVGLGRLGLPDGLAGLLLRDAATLARLAEAQCNGDWPCDNGERKVEWCSRCGGGMVRSKMKRLAPNATLGDGPLYLCEDCRTSARIADRLRPYAPQGIGVDFAGDPRGYVVKVWQAGGREVGLA